MPRSRLHVLQTYRYLRLAMVTLIAMLGASLLIEWHHTQPRCWETSVSAYYYTPARGIVVAATVAVGVCLVAIKGSTEIEDILLNFAGMVTPVIAFVPSRPNDLCHSIPVAPQDRSADIDNNMTAVFIAGGIALLVAAVMAFRAQREHRLTAIQAGGFALALIVYLAAAVWFWADRPTFRTWAHYTAAATMFVCVVATVVLNAVEFSRYHPNARPGRLPVNRYSLVALAMVVFPATMWVYGRIIDWQHAPFVIEGSLIGLFAVFWLIQTHELWAHGLQTRLAGGQPIDEHEQLPR